MPLVLMKVDNLQNFSIILYDNTIKISLTSFVQTFLFYVTHQCTSFATLTCIKEETDQMWAYIHLCNISLPLRKHWQIQLYAPWWQMTPRDRDSCCVIYSPVCSQQSPTKMVSPVTLSLASEEKGDIFFIDILFFWFIQLYVQR